MMNIMEMGMKIEEVKDNLTDILEKLSYDQLGAQERIEHAIELLTRADMVIGKISIKQKDLK
jgi:hypothetical protein